MASDGSFEDYGDEEFDAMSENAAWEDDEVFDSDEDTGIASPVKGAEAKVS